MQHPQNAPRYSGRAVSDGAVSDGVSRMFEVRDERNFATHRNCEGARRGALPEGLVR